MRVERLEPRQLRIKSKRMAVQDWVRQQQATLWIPEKALEACDGLADLRKVVFDHRTRVTSTGKTVAVVRCCDSGESLVKKLVETGTDPTKLVLPNLTNNEIACLRPLEAVSLVNTATYRESRWDEYCNPSQAFAKWALSMENLQVNCTLPDKFMTKIVHVGLVWNEIPTTG